MPTTYGAGDAWPLPTDHPHGLAAFCRVAIETTSSSSNVTVDVGCGEVNDARWNHLNIRYAQTRTRIDADSGAIEQLTSDRGCYGPHGPDHADSCTPGAQCFVDYYIPTTGYTFRTAWGVCITP